MIQGVRVAEGLGFRVYGGCLVPTRKNKDRFYSNGRKLTPQTSDDICYAWRKKYNET